MVLPRTKATSPSPPGTRCHGDGRGGSGAAYLPGRGTGHPAAPAQRVPTSSVSNCAFSTACAYPWSTKNGAPARDNSGGKGWKKKIIYIHTHREAKKSRSDPPASPPGEQPLYKAMGRAEGCRGLRRAHSRPLPAPASDKTFLSLSLSPHPPEVFFFPPFF